MGSFKTRSSANSFKTPSSAKARYNINYEITLMDNITSARQPRGAAPGTLQKVVERPTAENKDSPAGMKQPCMSAAQFGPIFTIRKLHQKTQFELKVTQTQFELEVKKRGVKSHLGTDANVPPYKQL